MILGAGDDARPLWAFARELGWEVLVVRHPQADASAAFAAAAELRVAAAEELQTFLQPDAQTAAVVMTHHFGRDLACLQALLPLRLPYLGLLGPRRRREQLLAEVANRHDAFDPDALRNLRSPAGLDLGSETPAEVALAITAEIRAVLAGRSGRPLRDLKRGIHDDPASSRAAAPPLRVNAVEAIA